MSFHGHNHLDPSQQQGQFKQMRPSPQKRPQNSGVLDPVQDGHASGQAHRSASRLDGYGYVDAGFTGSAFSQPNYSGPAEASVQVPIDPTTGMPNLETQQSSFPFVQAKRPGEGLVSDNRKKPKPGQSKGVKPSPIGTTLIPSVPHAPVQAGVKGFSKLVELVGKTFLPGFKDACDRELFVELLCAASAHVLLNFVEKMSAKYRPTSFEKVDVEIPLPPLIATAIGGYAVTELDEIKYYPHLATVDAGVRRWRRTVDFPDWDESIYMVQWSKLCSRYETSTRRSDSFTTDIPDRSLLLTSTFSDGGGNFWTPTSRGVKVASRTALSRRYELVGAALSFHTGDEGGSPYNVFIPKLSPSEIHLYPVLSSTRISNRGITSMDLELELLM